MSDMNGKSDMNGRIDRRSLLKIIGAAGASATVSTACRVGASGPDMSSLTGGEWDSEVSLATAGPGGNIGWKPGDALKFLPPEKIPTGGRAANLFAELPKEKLLTVYRRMVTSRKWELTVKDVSLTNKQANYYGPVHMYIGQEAIANGVTAALNEDDYVASTHRGHGHLIAKDGDLNKMAAEIFFRETGYNKGYGGSMHITDIARGCLGANGIVGASFYFGGGAGIAAQVKGKKQVSVAFGGDGAANSAYYFNTVRSCANHKIPTIFVIENNFFQTGFPMAAVTPTKYISDYTKGLGIPHHLVDGNDVTMVYAAAKEAVERARAGEGPSVIEGMTYRWMDHSRYGGAKPKIPYAQGLAYRTDEEVTAWMSRDPNIRYRNWLLAKGLATENELQKIESEVQAAVDASIEFALKSNYPAPEAGVLNTHAEGPVAATQFFNRKGYVFKPTFDAGSSEGGDAGGAA